MDSQLSVVINSPTHTPHKFTLDLSRQCTILELKEIIVTRLDTKLTVSDQRLIFGGRILDDKDTLDRVFEKVDCSTPIRFRGNSDNSPSTASTNTNTAATSGTDLNNFAFTPFTTATPAAATATGARDGRTETDASNSTTNTTTAYSPFPFMATAGGVPVMVPMAPQAMQYVLVNGMPYLVPAVYLPMLHYQQMQQTYGQFQFLPDGAPFLPSHQNINNINGNINNPIVDQVRAGAAVAAEAPQQNAQEIAARDQRRAASLWLLMKLAHQTGRLRIVRRIVQNPPAEDAAQGAANPVPGAAAPQPTQTTTSTSTTTTTTTSTSTSGPANSSASTANSSSNSGTNTQYAATSTSESSTTQQQQQQGGNAQAQETVTATTEAAQPQVSPWRSLEHALLTFVTSLVPAPQPDIDPAVAAAAAAGDRGM
ncbi:hypothetical protein KI688_005644 [Linnemannia hyalina]|uniref:Ubiquitin-like domain-containing protein n=1 Tax=Linnemannia hyalina TaxID=64524 RepID=A0A9P7Y2B6_9FUNG|nr:hypothetical protein KI688_005644 [Linnemannia hyalina]